MGAGEIAKRSVPDTSDSSLLQDTDDDACTKNLNDWKNDLDALFYKYQVDVALEAHQHSYEATWPVFNGTVYNGSLAAPYTNAKAPIHIVSGGAGCDEHTDTFGPTGLGPWSAFRSSTYGYGRLTAYNHTHLHWQQMHANNGSVLHEIDIIRTDRQ